MPPQVGKAEAGPVVHQAPSTEVHKEESKVLEKSTTGADTSAVDTKAAGRSAKGSKQNATDYKGHSNTQAQMARRKLHNQVPNRESGSIYESVKNAAAFVAVKLPAAAKAAGEASAESGANAIRRNGVEQLGKRKHPQDMVKGQMFEMEDITPATTNKSRTDKKTEMVSTSPATVASGGPIVQAVDHPKQYRQATQAGVEERLIELNNGGPLTDFEKKLVSEWVPKSGEEGKTLTPIKGINSQGNKMDKEVQAYKITAGGSGQLQTTYYDRNGKVLRDAGTNEPPLVNEGLGPIEYLGYAKLGKDLLTNVGKRVGEKLFAREAASVTKAETGTVVRTAEQELAKTETSTAARSAEQQIASESEKAGVKTYNTSWRQGSGTSVHVKPNGPAPKPPASEFTKAEEKAINELQDGGMLRREAEEVIRNTRGAENTVEVVHTTAEGTTRKRW